MSHLQALREIKQRAVSLSSQAFPPEMAEEVRRYATEAYRYCADWYGPPNDPQISCRLEQTPGNSMHVSYLGKHYLLISQQSTSPERLCWDIAHEMYHRVTAKRKGLAREMWVQEILACLTSYWFCRRQGFQEYAEDMKRQEQSANGQADLKLLRRSERNTRRWLLYGQDKYSPEFCRDLMRIGYALWCVVDADHICRMSQAGTLEEWVLSLPPEDQYAVCRILELPCGDKAVPASEKQWSRLHDGLDAKSDIEASVSDFERIAGLHPLNGFAAFELGRAYHQAKQHDAAIEAYHKAAELGYEDEWIPVNIGSVFWDKEDFASAAKWFRQAAEQEPEWANGHHYLASALKKIGDMASARSEWQKVLTLGDEHFTKLARKALEDNPLSDASASPASD